MLAREVDREPAGVTRAAGALVGDVRLAAAVDRHVALAEPPQRLAEAVERLGVAGGVGQRGGERVARGRPVRRREALPADRTMLHRP